MIHSVKWVAPFLALVAGNELTCNDIKGIYRDGACCGADGATPVAQCSDVAIDSLTVGSHTIAEVDGALQVARGEDAVDVFDLQSRVDAIAPKTEMFDRPANSVYRGAVFSCAVLDYPEDKSFFNPTTGAYAPDVVGADGTVYFNGTAGGTDPAKTYGSYTGMNSAMYSKGYVNAVFDLMHDVIQPDVLMSIGDFAYPDQGAYKELHKYDADRISSTMSSNVYTGYSKDGVEANTYNNSAGVEVAETLVSFAEWEASGFVGSSIPGAAPLEAGRDLSRFLDESSSYWDGWEFYWRQAFGHATSIPSLKKFIDAGKFDWITDDHDFGPNNAGREFVAKGRLKLVACEYMYTTDHPLYKQQCTSKDRAMYAEKTELISIGEPGITEPLYVQHIYLDEQWHKESWASPTYSAEADYWGEKQLTWLSHVLEKRADVRIVSTGTQVLLRKPRAMTHGRGPGASGSDELQPNYPFALKRLFEVIEASKASNIFLFTGNSHQQFYIRDTDNFPFALHEFGTGSLTHPRPSSQTSDFLGENVNWFGPEVAGEGIRSFLVFDVLLGQYDHPATGRQLDRSDIKLKVQWVDMNPTVNSYDPADWPAGFRVVYGADWDPKKPTPGILKEVTVDLKDTTRHRATPGAEFQANCAAPNFVITLLRPDLLDLSDPPVLTVRNVDSGESRAFAAIQKPFTTTYEVSAITHSQLPTLLRMNSIVEYSWSATDAAGQPTTLVAVTRPEIDGLVVEPGRVDNTAFTIADYDQPVPTEGFLASLVGTPGAIVHEDDITKYPEIPGFLSTDLLFLLAPYHEHVFPSSAALQEYASNWTMPSVVTATAYRVFQDVSSAASSGFFSFGTTFDGSALTVGTGGSFAPTRAFSWFDYMKYVNWDNAFADPASELYDPSKNWLYEYWHPARNGEMYTGYGPYQWEAMIPHAIADGVCHSAAPGGACRSMMLTGIGELAWFGLGANGRPGTPGLSDVFADIVANDLVEISYHTLDPGYNCATTAAGAPLNAQMLYIYGAYAAPFPSSSGRSWSNAIRINNVFALGGEVKLGTDSKYDAAAGVSFYETGKAGVTGATATIPQTAFRPLDWNKFTYKIDLKRRLLEFLVNDVLVLLVPYPYDDLQGIELRAEGGIDAKAEIQCPLFFDDLTVKRWPM